MAEKGLLEKKVDTGSGLNITRPTSWDFSGADKLLIPSQEEQKKKETTGLLQKTEENQYAREELPYARPYEAPPVPGFVQRQDRKPQYSIQFPLPQPVVINDDIRMVQVPGTETSSEFTGKDVVNFLFGGEMGIIGMKLDNAGFMWDWDVAKQQWSEEPLWVNLLNTVSLLGTMAFPIAKAAHTSIKFGKGATLLKRTGGISQTDELKRFQKMGLLETTKGADTPTLELLRRQEHYLSHYERLAKRVEAAATGGKMTAMDKLKFQFQKRFSNSYYNIVNSLVDGSPQIREQFYGRLNELMKAEDLGILFRNIPTGSDGQKILLHFINKSNPSLIGRQSLTPAEQRFADVYEEISRRNQQDMLDIGLLTPTQAERVGDIYFPAQLKGTPKPDISTTRTAYVPLGKKGGDVVLRSFEMPRLDSKTLEARGAELPDLVESLLSGKLITDPAEISTRGLVTSRLLANNYKVIRDIATDNRYAVRYDDVIDTFGSAAKAEKAGYISLNADRLDQRIVSNLINVIKKKDPTFLGKSDKLPFVRKAVFDDIFGESGVFAQTQSATNVLQLLTAIHKTSKTAFSIPTHFQNFASNIAMLSQAGFNVLSPKNLTLSKGMAEAFEKLAVARRGSDVKDLEKLGVNLGKIKVGEKTFDLNDEILDPAVRELIEDSAFDLVEGFSALRSMIDTLGKDQWVSRGIAKGFLKTKEVLQMGDKEGLRWMDQMTKWYLAEDMIPKMTYYMSLRGKGLSKQAAILETGRRLPMYKTVGSTIRNSRKVILPWATFPAEAARITKNNIMDYPLRMLPWLQMPRLAQGTLAAMGFAPGTEEGLETATQQLPAWAQNYSTVVGQQGPTEMAGSAGSGALLGGILGTKVGGAVGGLAGTALGAAAGAGFVKLLPDQTEDDRLRGIVLDWLPHSSFLLTTTSRDFGGDNTNPWQTLVQMQEQLPAEPLAIMKPIFEVLSGKNAWGEELQGEDVGDQFGKAFGGMVGFLMPPFIQKYGFKTTTPDITFSEWATGEPIVGDISNISRLLVDTGQDRDMRTGNYGSLTNDFFLRNFSILKSQAISAEQGLLNENMREEHLRDIRNLHSKNLAFFLENGKEAEAIDVLTKVMSTFTKQHIDDPLKAQVKYGEWLSSRAKQIGRHPRLRNWSEDEIKERLSKISDYIGHERWDAREKMINYLSNQVHNRKLERLANLKQKAIEKNQYKTPTQRFKLPSERLKTQDESYKTPILR